jgi:hypothetical protein
VPGPGVHFLFLVSIFLPKEYLDGYLYLVAYSVLIFSMGSMIPKINNMYLGKGWCCTLLWIAVILGSLWRCLSWNRWRGIAALGCIDPVLFSNCFIWEVRCWCFGCLGCVFSWCRRAEFRDCRGYYRSLVQGFWRIYMRISRPSQRRWIFNFYFPWSIWRMPRRSLARVRGFFGGYLWRFMRIFMSRWWIFFWGWFSVGIGGGCM